MDGYRIVVDNRELKNGVVKELFRNNIKIINEQLEVGDFIIPDNIACERKSVEDFVNSMLDGRLFKQVKDLIQNFQKPFLIIEGTKDIYSVRNVHANAIRGAIASLAIDFKIPLIFTKDEKDTAHFFIAIIKREAQEKREAEIRGKTKPLTDDELMEYIISSFPGVGRRTAKNILEHFKTITGFVTSQEDKLTMVEGVGKITAQKIKEIINREYTRT